DADFGAQPPGRPKAKRQPLGGVAPQATRGRRLAQLATAAQRAALLAGLELRLLALRPHAVQQREVAAVAALLARIGCGQAAQRRSPQRLPTLRPPTRARPTAAPAPRRRSAPAAASAGAPPSAVAPMRPGAQPPATGAAAIPSPWPVAHPRRCYRSSAMPRRHL